MGGLFSHGCMQHRAKQARLEIERKFNLQKIERNSTELSKHVWKLKDQQKMYKIEWNILSDARPYSNKTKICQLCNLENVFIIRRPELGTLNKRNELASTCRHRAPFLFRNFKIERRIQ